MTSSNQNAPSRHDMPSNGHFLLRSRPNPEQLAVAMAARHFSVVLFRLSAEIHQRHKPGFDGGRHNFTLTLRQIRLSLAGTVQGIHQLFARTPCRAF